MRDLFILGTGVHGGEIAEIIERINRVKPAWNLIGFVEQDTAKSGGSFNGYPILGLKEVLGHYPEAALVPEYEWPLKEEMRSERRLVTIADPSAFISRTAVIQPGTVLYPNCFVGLNARIGRFVFCLSGSVINHDAVLEDNVTLASGVRLAGSVHVEQGAYLGQASTVMEKLRIGGGSLIGMGSVVIRDVPPGSVMAGNPAKQIGSRD
ncbi:hypothetical protein GXP70_20250 [Paenibacillus lycopersici]|uniref:PglD N-terminal domain-containing protein n=1 Tax=Paenibacillus lycopersici TaxID=2704462 RepID=A0A6C0G414_9BACL|nr:hypothetical protein [Paenibacillus lycopersici]QHT62079.1 hypothetical protein GXP70_20250 [Paenibacillus lycopersici]